MTARVRRTPSGRPKPTVKAMRGRRRGLLEIVLASGAVVCATVAASAASAPLPAFEAIEGGLQLLHTDAFRAGEGTFTYVLDDGRRKTPLDVSDVTVPFELVGEKVRLRGDFRGDTFVLAKPVERVGSPRFASLSTTETRRVAVLLLNFANDRSEPWTADAVRGVVFTNPDSVAAYYAEVAYGLTLSGDVFGWYSIPDDSSSCDPDAWMSHANAAATARGVNLTAYEHVVYAFPRAASCGWSGMAAVRGRESLINGSMTLHSVGHELGHNLGSHHASSYSCSDAGVPVALSADATHCARLEYGDPFSIMGGATSLHHHALERLQEGWLSDVQAISAAGTFSVAPVELGGAPRLLRVARGDGNYFYLDFRQPYGFDAFGAADPAVTGVTIRLAPDSATLTQSLLLDTTPATSSFADAPLGVGRTFTDPLSSISVTTLAVSPLGASVRIDLGTTPADTRPPTAPSSLRASVARSKVNLTWNASTDDVGVAGYRISRSGVLAGTTSSTGFTDTLPRKTKTAVYSVVSYDAAGNQSAQSNTVTVTSR